MTAGRKPDIDGDRARLIGTSFTAFRHSQRKGYDAAKTWLYARGLGITGGVIVDRKTPDQAAAALDARRVNRDPCYRCATRMDRPSPSCREAHPTPAVLPLSAGHLGGGSDHHGRAPAALSEVA